MTLIQRDIFQKAGRRFQQAWPWRKRFIKQAIVQRGRIRRIGFWPHRPHRRSVIYKICNHRGWWMTRTRHLRPDLAIHWHYDTYPATRDAFRHAMRGVPVLNRDCQDISKQKVNEAMRAAFGYDVAVDPRRHCGPCVEKSDANAKHDGRVIDCPIDEPRSGAAYQRVVNNVIEGGYYIEDIRVPMIAGAVPLVYIKHRLLIKRFDSFNASVQIVDPGSVLSDRERDHLVAVARYMGIDYGEVDALRDRDDGRLYVVDVNATPHGPPNGLAPADLELAIDDDGPRV